MSLIFTFDKDLTEILYVSILDISVYRFSHLMKIWFKCEQLEIKIPSPNTTNVTDIYSSW